MVKTKKENRNYLSHFLVIGSGTIINMILGFIITPIITRIVDPAENGMMSIFNLYASIAIMVLSLGLDQALVRFYYDKEEPSYKKQLLKICVILPVVITIIVSLIFLVLVGFYPRLFQFDYFVLWLLVFYVFTSLINRISLLVLRVQYNSKVFALCNIVNRITYLLVAIVLIRFQVINSFIALIIATTISVALPTFIAIINSKEVWKFRNEKINININELLKYSMPLIVSSGLAILFQSIDKISLNYFCSYSEIGIYTAALSIVSVFEVVQTTFNTVWAPLQIEQYTKNVEHKSFIQNINKYIVVIMFFLGFCLIMFKGVFALFLGEKYREAEHILPFLVFYPIMYTMSETTRGGIAFTKKTYLYVVVVLVSCIVNVIGNLLLIPRIGYKGAAISTGISYIVYFYLNTFISNKLYYMDFQLWKITILIAMLVGFSFYNTFLSSLLFRVVIFTVSIFMIFLLYKQTVIDLFKRGYKYILERIRK